MRLYLTGHVGFGNRGCEALVRTTAQIVRRWRPQARLSVPSLDANADRRLWPEAETHGVDFVPAPPVPLKLVPWARLVRSVPAAAALRWPSREGERGLLRELERCDGVLSIGGDNYTLDYGLCSLAAFVGVAEAALRRRQPVVLWGASVGPFTPEPGVERRMQDHLSRLSAITVRDGNSADYLQQLGLGVRRGDGATSAAAPLRVADSAFLLEPAPSPRPASAPSPAPPHTSPPQLGLNLSPLMRAARGLGVRDERAALVAHAAEFVRRVLSQHRWSVVLVPHVGAHPSVGAEQDDGRLLAEVAARVGPHPLLHRASPQLNAAELKALIAGCDAFIGARMHATIAALSSGVPTLSLSYSPKAIALQQDLLGSQAAVLDGRRLSAPRLERGFEILLERADGQRARLAEQLPAWRQRAWSATGTLERVFGASAAA